MIGFNFHVISSSHLHEVYFLEFKFATPLNDFYEWHVGSQVSSHDPKRDCMVRKSTVMTTPILPPITQILMCIVYVALLC